jgi:para-nitrobenzyl esterase
MILESTTGKLGGHTVQGVHTFKGIPYADSTAGANRFLPPQPVTPWAGVRDANAFGDSAPQSHVPHDLLYWYGQIRTISEDCLTLNVYTPGVEPGIRRPVMVWLHGGGWWAFSSTAPALEGQRLALRGDVVVVTLNHRLNLFGHLALEDTDPRFADAGNVGVLDMVAALRWVQDNVASFGGDPSNVTLFGHSGGAGKVCALMATDAAKGLFHKAIAQSGSGCLRVATRTDGAEMAHGLASQLGLARLTGEALQAIPMEHLVAASAAAPRPYRPVLDGRTFTRHPFDLDAPAQSIHVPFIAGNAGAETRLKLAANLQNFALDAGQVELRIARFLRLELPEARRVMQAYQRVDPAASPGDLLAAISTDYTYIRNTRRAALLQAAAGKAPVYAYQFDWCTTVCDGALRAPHGVEVPFIFGRAEEARDMLGTSPDHGTLTDMMMATWSAFAHTGTPNNPTLPPWPRFDAARRSTMVLDVHSHVDQDPGGDARSSLDALPYYDYHLPMNFATHCP